MNMKFVQNPIDKIWKRHFLIKILYAALETGENRFAHQVALSWLAYYPGDLLVKLLRARALMADGSLDQCLPILQELVNRDPENYEAHLLLHEAGSRLGIPENVTALGCSIALGKKPKYIDTQISKNIGWSYSLALTRKLIAKGNYKKAERHIQQVLGEASHTPLSGVTHLNLLRSERNTPKKSLQHLAEHYHDKWPDCIQFILILADTLMDGGEIDRGVSLLHQAASHDVTGRVAKRIWGSINPYKNLWPNNLQAPVITQIPSSITAFFGWNLLSISETQIASEGDKKEKPTDLENLSMVADGSKKPDLTENNIKKLNLESGRKRSHQEKVTDTNHTRSSTKLSAPETLLDIGSQLAGANTSTTKKKNPNAEGCFPIYVVLTTRKGLRRKYGEKTAIILEHAMRKLVMSIRKRLDWGSILIYPDDPATMAQYGIKPVPPDDPWKLKLSLTDLNVALGKRGARIGAVLIVGGTEIVPFHLLPNPTDDADTNIPSDNPYSTTDENYFISEWPVGRIPGGKSNDPGLLLSVLRSITERHNNYQIESDNFIMAILAWLKDIFMSRGVHDRNSFGFTAEAWRQASSSVFRSIGDPKALFTSPPTMINNNQPLPLTKMGYFNLHGVRDSVEWFGQRDPRNGESGPDFPIALHPNDIPDGSQSPLIIFSEACYGAHILEKSIDDALSLKFLASGAQAFIGSTVISYGSITPPLNAADLLSMSFWNFFKEGFPAGESLLRAKIFLAKEMHNRQGYLDGEDQKTLVSFVLYGDPLARENELKQSKTYRLFSENLQVPNVIKTVCDREDASKTQEEITNDVIANVKKIVDQYLPGMRDAHVSINRERVECTSDGHECPTSQLGPKGKFESDPERRVVTLSKQIKLAKYVHESYARLTLDKNGNIVKLAVSR